MNSNKFQLSRLIQPSFVGLVAGSSFFLAGTAKANELVESPALDVVPTASANLPAAPTDLPGTFSTLVTDVNSSTEAGQVTSVSQLSDVQPTDWAFQALQSLVERYGCIAGYPDGTFRGNRAATRYELAAALNACLDQISDRFATKEDLAAVKALQEEFRAELATLKGRVDGLEARTKTLEAQQFSTTTKLSGEVLFVVSEVFSGDDRRAVSALQARPNLNARPIFGNRARLNFDTSFNGTDRLRVRLQARDIESFSTVSGTNMARLGYDGDNDNQFQLDDLWYRFNIGKNAKVAVIANSGEYNDFVGDTFNPFLSSSSNGALSRFGRFNPIYRFSDGGAGVIANYKFSDKVAVSVGYLADSPTNSIGPRGGLFGGTYSALAQLEFKPFKNVGLGLTYVHAFQEGISDPTSANLTGSTGSNLARRPFGNVGTESNSAGLEFTWKVAKWLNISGWGGVTFAESTVDNRSATVLNWATSLVFPDLLIPGNMGALIIGQQPRIVGGSVSRCGASGSNQNAVPDCDMNLHLEALYKFKVNGNITITPGVIVLLNPENNERNSTEFVPVVRTTFTF
jgi:Carbohydrate-selective porin, OprB family/S-layer homology domain